jgi:hypothetical protein
MKIYEVAKVPVFSLTCLVIVTDGAGKICFAIRIYSHSLTHSLAFLHEKVFFKPTFLWLPNVIFTRFGAEL